MRLWGIKGFSKLIYDAAALFKQYGDALTKECTDDEFMALYEAYPEFDDLDDEFVDTEEEITNAVAHYIDENIEQFAEVVK